MSDAVRVRVGQSNAIRITQSDRVNSFSRLDDVDLLTNGQNDGGLLVYESSTQKWTARNNILEPGLTIDGGLILMASPTTRQELIDHCLRRLGAPVLEINVDDDQISDLVDDAIQYFQERHYDGSERMYLKYKITEDDINRGRGPGNGTSTGITTTTVSESVGITSEFKFEENSNYIKLPDHILAINKVFKFDTNAISGGMFSIKYQLFLNDLYYFSSVDLLHYSMTKRYLEDIDALLTTDKQLRFNQRQGRLYLDLDWDFSE